jgi:hypothetical protein
MSKQQIETLNAKVTALETEVAALKTLITTPVKPEINKLAQKQAELESVQASTKMKPDTKAKKIETLEKQISKIQKSQEPKPENKSPKFTKKFLDAEVNPVLGKLLEELDEKDKTEMMNKLKAYFNSLSDDSRKTVSYKIHTENFKYAPTPEGLGMTREETEEESEEETQEKKDETDKNGGGALMPKSHDFLIKHQDSLKVIRAGVYEFQGERVTGPDRDEENEDLDEKTFDGEKFLVDEATGRVYNEDEEFVGFARIKNKKFNGII